MTSSDPKKQLLDSTRNTLKRYGMIEPGSGVVCGVSGGPDSTAMLNILDQLKSEFDCSLTVAHLDHALRSESSREADFVRKMAEGLDVRVVIKRVDVQALARDQGVSIEEAGRNARYSFFEEVRISEDANRIATAHHKDDELETFFLRILRGSSLTGLGGIHPVRKNIIRPLIKADRERILDFLKQENIPYLTDPTNQRADADRSFVRNRIVPVIKERFPDFAEPRARTIDLVREEESILERITHDLYSRTVTFGSEDLEMQIVGLAQADRVLLSRVILTALYRASGPDYRWTSTHVKAILNLVLGSNPSARLDLPRGLTVQRKYDRIVFLRESAEESQFESISVRGPGIVDLPHVGMRIKFIIRSREPRPSGFPDGIHSALFDADELSFPLELRSPRPGDRFSPWGLHGTRKLKKILIDYKIPVSERKTLPILVSGEEILWIPGIRRGSAAPVRKGTDRVLEVVLVGNGT
jgi:tRNA(Ile)-lysidine synthase